MIGNLEFAGIFLPGFDLIRTRFVVGVIEEENDSPFSSFTPLRLPFNLLSSTVA